MTTIPENLPPEEIERRSFAIITRELGDAGLDPRHAPVIKRVIHATADFDFARTLVFSDGALEAGLAALRRGAAIVTDTRMAWSGINKTRCAGLGCEVQCLIADAEVAAAAKAANVTRSRAAVDKAAELWPEAIYVVGNAPTALIRIHELIGAGRLAPALVVGVPVGFVNVVESKELILASPVPSVVATGRKGGSTVAAAVVNAMVLLAGEG